MECYELAYRRIYEYNYNKEINIEAIIPVAIDFNERTGVNIDSLSSEKTPWYNGLTLTDAIKQQTYRINEVYEKSHPDNLLFSVDREILTPRSGAGKVWRILLRNGNLKVDDKIKITSVNLAGYPKKTLFNIEAKVKSIHEEFSYKKKNMDSNIGKGSIATIDLQSCYIDGEKIEKRRIQSIDKKMIQITRQSIGISSHEVLSGYNNLFVYFEDNCDIVYDLRKGQHILLYWFGKRIFAKIINIISNEGMNVQLLNNIKITVPKNKRFKNLDLIRKIVMRAERGNEICYFSGLLEFEKRAI
jgi:hypothetical protein